MDLPTPRASLLRRFRESILTCLCWMSLVPIGARADLFTYDNSAAFTTAIAGRPLSTLNFDSSGVGIVVSNGLFFQGVRFVQSAPVQGDLIVTDGTPDFSPGLKTLSGLNYLGNSIGQLMKRPVVFEFQAPVTSVGMYFISTGDLNPNDVGMTVGSTNAQVNLSTRIDLGPTSGNLVPSFAYFIGIVESNPALSFSSVAVNLNLPVGEGIGIDNLSFTAVPEPSTFLSIGLALFFAMIVRRKRVLAYAPRVCSVRS